MRHLRLPFLLGMPGRPAALDRNAWPLSSKCAPRLDSYATNPQAAIPSRGDQGVCRLPTHDLGLSGIAVTVRPQAHPSQARRF